MDAARWERIQDLFHRAVELPVPSRSKFLEGECAGDAALAADVQRMLDEDARSASVLDRELGSVAREVFDSEGAATVPSNDFGPYRATRLLGEGGMGVVYFAERSDLGSVAAVKILRDAWLSPARRERFAGEQRTLAQLNHPWIAHLYDAGTLPEGTPWIAMEYVEGVPLTQYCDKHGSSVPERLRLFRDVCEAVQHAHRHAIIHRDLKPTNILVREDNTIKLLDFGIAKQLDEAGDAAGDRTRTGWRLVTPAYAAPEQITGGPLGVYTDVYALGVVLYELLAGRLPFDLSTSTPGQAERLIVEAEPTPPSVAVREAAKGTGGGPLRSLGKSAWADLDVLCLTAMSKEPTRRYSTVDALIRDVDHYLAGEPLEARPDSVRYRLGKFARRHRRSLLIAGAVWLAVVGLTAFYAVRLTSARNAALAEAARAGRIQRFMTSLFEGGDEEAGPSDSLRVVSLLERGVEGARLLDAEPAVQAELYETLGVIYQQLGRPEPADSLLQAALEQRRSLFGPEHADVARSLLAVGMLRLGEAQYDEAERLVREGLEMARRTLPRKDPFIPQAMVTLGRVLEERGEYEDAATALEDALRAMKGNGAPDADLAEGLHELANTHFYAGDYAASDSLNLKVLEITRRLYGDRHPNVADDLINLGAGQVQIGRYTEGERYFREGLEITRAWYGDDHPATASSLTMLARSLVLQERVDEAEEQLQRALVILERVHGPMHPRVASILNELGAAALLRGNLDKAEAYFRRILSIYRSAYGEKHDLVALATANLASVHLKRGDYALAEREFRDAVKLYGEVLSPEHLNVGIARIKLGRTLLRQKRFAEAEVESRAGYEIVARQSDPSVSWLQAARGDLVEAYTALGRPEEAAKFRVTPSDSGG